MGFEAVKIEELEQPRRPKSPEVALAYSYIAIPPRPYFDDTTLSATTDLEKLKSAYFPEKLLIQIQEVKSAIQELRSQYSRLIAQKVELSDASRWLSYLARLNEEPVKLTEEYARSIRAVWSKLISSVGSPIRPPSAGPGGELGFQLAWNDNEYYLDIDIAPDGQFAWFYKDKINGQSHGSEDGLLSDPPEELVRLLVRFCLL
jgi:hypothetical protein